jgi:hypothetical protein
VRTLINYKIELSRVTNHENISNPYKIYQNYNLLSAGIRREQVMKKITKVFENLMPMPL